MANHPFVEELSIGINGRSKLLQIAPLDLKSCTRITKATPKLVLQVLEDSYFLVGLIYIELFGAVRMEEARERNVTPAIPADGAVNP